MSASVAYGIRQLPSDERDVLATRRRGRDGRLLVWIVGAREAMEGELARGGHLAEPLAALCPPSLASHGLEVVLIGPEMETWEFERQHPTSATTLLVCARSGTLHALDDASLRVGDASMGGRPDLMVLFNSGIGTLLWPLVEGWVPTIALLLSLRDVPLILTCFNAHEAGGEEAVLSGAFKAATVLESRRNPLAHATPLECAACRVVDDAAAEIAEINLDQLAADAEAKAAADEKLERARDEVVSPPAPLPPTASGGGDAAAATPARVEATRTNNFIKIVRGSSFDDASLAGEAQAKAAELVRHCAKMFAVKNMDAWLEQLTAYANAGSEAGETLACNVMLLAEATKEPALALTAARKGAVERLAMALQGGAIAHGAMTGDAPAGSAPAKSYSGMPATERVLRSGLEALQNINAAVTAARALEQPPTADETLIEGGAMTTYRNTYKGQFINVRAEPSVNAAVVARLPQGATVRVAAERGGWLRLEPGGEHALPASSWALVHHPLHGALLEPVR